METEAPAEGMRPPVVLIVNDHEWSSRSIESVLAPRGFAVMRAFKGSDGLERARAYRPDVVIVDADLPDMDGLEVCRQLRDQKNLGGATPILLTTAVRPERRRRLEAFQAGAWDVVSYPVDGEELVLRLTAYVAAKFESDRRGDMGLVDDRTGLYNFRGVERRVKELTSWAYREGRALACLVVAPELEELADDASEALAERIAAVIKETGRVSDVFGRLGKNEFVIIAPGTDAAGAVRLAHRLAEAAQQPADQSRGGADALRFRAGYDVITDVREEPSVARDVVVRATKALRVARRIDGDWLVRFDEPSAQN